jgi:hypothetical protein
MDLRRMGHLRKLRVQKVQRESLFLKLDSKEFQEAFLRELSMRGIPK